MPQPTGTAHRAVEGGISQRRNTPSIRLFFLMNQAPSEERFDFFPVSLLILMWRFKLEGKPTTKSHNSTYINVLFLVE